MTFSDAGFPGILRIKGHLLLTAWLNSLRALTHIEVRDQVSKTGHTRYIMHNLSQLAVRSDET